jgi:hypothetical protein
MLPLSRYLLVYGIHEDHRGGDRSFSNDEYLEAGSVP